MLHAQPGVRFMSRSETPQPPFGKQALLAANFCGESPDSLPGKSDRPPPNHCNLFCRIFLKIIPRTFQI
ncbi:MAG: hypothetical protein SXA11_07380 [Cyanobacteriota bacterium]|nr:hypothetical protein [Cyanobacteriota bacterium]